MRTFPPAWAAPSNMRSPSNAHRQRPAWRTLIAAVVPATLLALTAPLHAADKRTTKCEGIDVTVIHDPAQEVGTICAAVSDTVGFMTASGFELKRGFSISIVDGLTPAHGLSSLGTYTAATDSIEMLSYRAALELLPEQPPFGIAMNPELYRSFIVHEAAHAIAHPNFVRRPNVAAQEYIAYTAQFAAMPEPLRNSILQNIPTEGFEQPKEIGDQLLMLDPGRFAVKSWLHFIRPENGPAFYQRLLTGRF